jgi:hypothetical protein
LSSLQGGFGNADHGLIREQGLDLAAICVEEEEKTGFLGFSAKEDTKDLRLFSLKYGLRRTPAMAVSSRDTKGQRST